MSESTWGYAAGSAPQYGPSASPRSYRYAEKPEPNHERWQDRALCREVDPERWFPEKGGSSIEAKRICNSPCPVKAECLEDALTGKEKFGIRAGLSERERAKLIKQRQAEAGEAA